MFVSSETMFLSDCFVDIYGGGDKESHRVAINTFTDTNQIAI